MATGSSLTQNYSRSQSEIQGDLHTCDRCQKFNYKKALPAGCLIPIVSNYPNEIVTLDLLGPYPAFRPKRNRFLLVITDHFTKLSELIPLRKASAQALANALFENYISRYGAPISFISDNGPQFISEVFEHLSHRSAEYVGRNIEKLFDEARQNMRKQHKHWEKYYNRKRREVNIKVNDLVLVQTHFISAAGRRVVGKFMPKFKGPYRVLEVRNNNLIIWKKGKRVTVNIYQVRVYRPRQSDTISLDCHVETLYEGQRSSNGSNRSHPGKFKGSSKTSSEESKGRKSQIMGSEHRDQKRPTPEPKQGIKREIPSSVPSRNYKYRRLNNPSQGSQSIAGPSHLRNARQGKPPTEGSKHDMTGQYDKARETRTTTSGINRAAERRPARSKQATAVSETLSLLPTQPCKAARRNSRGSEEHWN
ncbi:uncharacterized protein TNCV_317401 [Trichonephila clavipes]|nr:uncharacterized protein TNCV_317401 [Trichonephila clavipes]